MNVFPRSAWTSHLPKETQHADRVDDLLYFTRSGVIGIMLHAHLGAYPLLNRDPNAHLESVRRNDVSILGYSDIKYNLGVGPRVSGVWELRGLTNKGSGSDTPEFNHKYIHIYCQLAADEKPTDAMVESLIQSRQLVLSLYPNATKVVGHTAYGSKAVTCPGEYLQQVVESSIWDDTTPVGKFSPQIPQMNLWETEQNIHVFDLISQLTYLGYYRMKNTGKYDVAVRQAVKELQVELKEGGYYNRTIDGQYGPYTRKGWSVALNNLWMTASGK